MEFTQVGIQAGAQRDNLEFIQVRVSAHRRGTNRSGVHTGAQRDALEFTQVRAEIRWTVGKHALGYAGRDTGVLVNLVKRVQGEIRRVGASGLRCGRAMVGLANFDRQKHVWFLHRQACKKGRDFELVRASVQRPQHNSSVVYEPLCRKL
eukprot:803044-Pelagomonas_calceolata.AAC.13